MSDSAAAEFTVYQVEGKEDAIAEILNDEDFVAEYGYSAPLTSSDITSGATLVNDNARIGALTDIGQALEQLSVPYRATQEAKGPYDAELRVYTPELGQNTITGSNDGSALVSSQVVDALADVAEALLIAYDPEGPEGAALSKAIKDARLATATQWTRALKALAPVKSA